MKGLDPKLDELVEAQIEIHLARLAPGRQLRARVDGHDFVVMITDQSGIHSGRSRYLVACATCDELCHEATTGPGERVRSHVARARRLEGSSR